MNVPIEGMFPYLVCVPLLYNKENCYLTNVLSNLCGVTVPTIRSGGGGGGEGWEN